MKTFVLSDSHFCNANIIKYSNRPFDSAEHQTTELIERWNSVVAPDDRVLHLGDFIMGAADNVDLILPQLNGTIILTRGNHDTDAKLARYANYPDKITVKDLHYEQHGGLWFVCCHFPLTSPDFLSMVTRDNSEVVTLFGHVHDKRQFADLADHTFNCSVEVIDYTPVNLHTIWELVRDDFKAKGVWRGKE